MTIYTPAYWPEAKEALSQADPVMAGIIAQYQGETLVSRGDAFHTLARSIVGQQISVKAADAVWARVEPKVQSLAFSEESLQNCGLSRQKIIYLKSLAEFFHRESITCGYWEGMSDEEVIRHLTQVKGIGRWSAEMFLIFHLLRPDVFPVDDIGLQKAIVKNYAVDNHKKSLTEYAQLWQPYRSVATWYLWRSLDPVPVEY